MSDLLAPQRPALAPARMTARELAVLADLAALVGERDRCIAIIARIYEMLDDQSYEIPTRPKNKDAGSEAKAWSNGQERFACDKRSASFWNA